MPPIQGTHAPYARAMAGDLTARLARVKATNARIAKLDGQRSDATEKRDREIRDAFAAGASWEQLEATGVSRATIQKAKNGRARA